MHSQQTSPSDEDPKGLEALAMLEQLKSSRAITFKLYWLPYFTAICYAVVAWFTSRDFFVPFLGILVVVFLLEDMSRRRMQVQVDLILRLFKEYYKRKDHDPR